MRSATAATAWRSTSTRRLLPRCRPRSGPSPNRAFASSTRRSWRTRISRAYAWRKFLDAGALVAGGTDAPVEAGDPRVEFYAAIARRTLEGFAGPDWGLDQRLTRGEALAILTKNAAYAAFQEKELGTLTPGM